MTGVCVACGQPSPDELCRLCVLGDRLTRARRLQLLDDPSTYPLPVAYGVHVTHAATRPGDAS